MSLYGKYCFVTKSALVLAMMNFITVIARLIRAMAIFANFLQVLETK